MTTLTDTRLDEPTVKQHQQRMSAIEVANQVRTARKEIKQSLKAGELTIEGLLLDPPDVVLKVQIIDLLQWCAGDGIGRAVALKILRGTMVSPTLPIQHVGEASRKRIIDRLPRYRRVYAPAA